MNIRLRETLALILTVAVTFISFFGPVPVQAQAQVPAFAHSTIVALANQDRAEAGVGALTEDLLLSKAAQAKADDMAAKGYFSHLDPSGRAPWMWFKKAGYYYWSAGENLAVNFSDAESLNRAWMNSPAHRANIMRAGYSRVGLGVAHGTYQGKPATFIVEFFAKPYVVAPKVAVR